MTAFEGSERVRHRVRRAHHGRPALPPARKGATPCGRRRPPVSRGSGRCRATTPTTSSTSRALYAGNPPQPEAWRDVIARVQAAAARQPRRSPRCSPPSRNGGRRRPRRARPPRGWPTPRRVAVLTGQQAGAFGGPHVHAAQGDHGDPAGARGSTRAAASPAVPIFWVDAEDHDWDEIAGCTVLDAEFQPRDRHAGGPRGGRASGRSPRSRSTNGVEQTIDELAALLPQPRPSPHPCSPACAPRSSRASASRKRSRAGSKSMLGPVRAGRVRVGRSGGQAAGGAGLRDRSCARAGQHRRPRRRGRASDGRAAAMRRRSCRSPTTGRLPSSTAGARRSSAAATASSIGDTHGARRDAGRDRPNRRPAASARTCCSARSCRTRSSRPSATWPARASWPTSASCATSTREFGVPMPLMFRARHRDAARLGRGPLPAPLPRRSRGSPAAGRIRAEPPARIAAPRSVEQSLRDAGEAITTQHGAGRGGAAGARSRRSPGAAKTTLGKMEHELQCAPLQVIHAAKKPRRHAPPPVRPRAGAGRSRRATRRSAPWRRLLPEPVRPGLVDRLLEELPIDPGSTG